jgi:hypothetical protein
VLTLSRTNSTFFDGDPDLQPFTASATGGSRPYQAIAQRPLFPDIYQAAIHQDVVAVKEMMKHGQPYLGVFLFKLKTNRQTQTSAHSVTKLAHLESLASEANVTPNYLDRHIRSLQYCHLSEFSYTCLGIRRIYALSFPSFV